MTRIRDLSFAELKAELAAGLNIRTGRYLFRIHSREPVVVAGVRKLYADFPIDRDSLRDFHVAVRRPRNIRRWYRPQIVFEFDRTLPFKPLSAAHAFASLEWGMNWCIAAYGHAFLTLHAAVLERNGRAVLMPGEPGAGKSTLTAALSLSGWRLLTDETAIVDLETGMVWPVARPVNLKNDSIDIITEFSADAVFGDKVRDTHKGVVAHLKPSEDSVLRMDQACPVGWVVFPRWNAGAESRLTSRSRADTFVYAAENSFNYNVLGDKGFRALEKAIRGAECFDFRYGRLDDAMLTFERLAR